MELKTARLTVLIDPTTKKAFEVACHDVDMTPSQVVRRLIREFMEEKAQRSKSKASARRSKGR